MNEDFHWGGGLRKREEVGDGEILNNLSLPACVCALDAQHRYIYANRRYAEIFDHDPDDILGEHVQNVIGCENFKLLREEFEAALHGKSVYYRRDYINKSGGKGVIDVHLVPEHTADGEPVSRYFGLLREVTEEVMAAEGARRSAERFSTLFRATPGPTCLVRIKDGAIIDVNRAYEKMYGVDRSYLIGCNSISHPTWLSPEGQSNWISVLNDPGSPCAFEAKRCTADGEVIDVLITSEHINFDGDMHLLSLHTNITQRKLKETRLEHMATHDALTGLPNRPSFLEHLSHISQVSKGFAVMFIDLDGFKATNDTLGHSVGDRLLCEVVDRFKSCLTSSDFLARLGGDEFTIVTLLSHETRLSSLAENLRDSLQEPFAFDGYRLCVTASIGISVFPRDGLEPVELLKRADSAMYQAKEHGKNDFRFYEEGMGIHVLRRNQIDQEVRIALTKRQLYLCFQPRFDLSTGKSIGAEALLRWRHPVLGEIAPDEFIPIAEKNGSIFSLSEWVLREACLQIRRWRDMGIDYRLAVNLSARQFRQANLEEIVLAAIQEAGIPAQSLELEIRECVLMENVEAAADVLNRLVLHGVRISVDNFGTGFSNLNCLERFSAKFLKMDRCLVAGVDGSRSDAAIAKAVIAMAHALNLKVIAVGVETRAQARFLREQGCDVVQGYLYGEAMPEPYATDLAQMHGVEL